MQLFYAYITGLVILLLAIVANGIANKLELTTWYDLLTKKQKPTALSILWLYIIYPLILGLPVLFILLIDK